MLDVSIFTQILSFPSGPLRAFHEIKIILVPLFRTFFDYHLQATFKLHLWLENSFDLIITQRLLESVFHFSLIEVVTTWFAIRFCYHAFVILLCGFRVIRFLGFNNGLVPFVLVKILLEACRIKIEVFDRLFRLFDAVVLAC